MSEIKFEVGAVYSYKFRQMAEHRGLYKALEVDLANGTMLVKEFPISLATGKFVEKSYKQLVDLNGNSLALQYSDPATMAECIQFQLLEDTEKAGEA